jgi:hypothetical protein
MTIGQYFENELAVSLNKTIEEVFPERQIMGGLGASLKEGHAITIGTSLLDFNTSISAYRNEFEYDVWSSAGIAEFYTHAADDIPLVSSGREVVYGRLKEIALGDQFTRRDVQRNQAEGGRMIEMSTRAIHRGHDVKLEEIFYLGNTEHRLFGLTNFPNVATQTLPNDGVGALTTFASKTPAQKYRDLVTMLLAVSQRSNNAYNSTRVLFPLNVYNDLNTTLFTGVTNTGQTVMEIVKRNFSNNPIGNIEIVPVPFLNGKGTGGTGLGIVYTKSPENQEAFLSQYMQRDANTNDEVNYKFSYQYTSVTGGTVIYQPLSAIKFDGI